MKLGLAQIDIVWEDKSKNKINCIELINEAKDQNVDLLVFPEMTLTGFSMNIEEIGEIFDKSTTIDFFRKQAISKSINIGFGYVEKKQNTALNKFIIISAQGQIISNYTKIHPFSYGNETKHYSSGEEIQHCEVNGIIISPLICYDLRFPEIFQACSYKSSLIIVIANWPKSRIEHWRTLLKARAIENQCYIAGVNRVGSGDNLLYNGNSMIINPYGEVITEKINDQGLVIGDINVENVKDYRIKFNIKNDRKEKLYIKLYNEFCK
ncbi:carbon-nitrogen family hydrolase [Clostridium cellulovorans]|uniref:Nitrilase/cyanide hydratase and apolipoprotein N-acyltransferase n=1 Tax=Clostridium cellulovorans (strain ATCC 35296 / DSM 3052 / OCM 3 / 743B) TaxID=573061 RepID=D9STR4_CLOC7|nr:carbon-nitrogen family hydrolase [Clostridium cellulovorans]ADL52798.1 Nitrilase/cyanide hydratase and apolipoprotein N-acyltransferase [Clostridium cellulovorans 743B]